MLRARCCWVWRRFAKPELRVSGRKHGRAARLWRFWQAPPGSNNACLEPDLRNWNGNGRPGKGSAGFRACCIAGFPTRERWNNSRRSESPLPCRLGSRRYSRLGNLRYAERRFHLGIRVKAVATCCERSASGLASPTRTLPPPAAAARARCRSRRGGNGRHGSGRWLRRNRRGPRLHILWPRDRLFRARRSVRSIRPIWPIRLVRPFRSRDVNINVVVVIAVVVRAVETHTVIHADAGIGTPAAAARAFAT